MKSLTCTEIDTIAKNLSSLSTNINLKSCSIALTKRGKPWGISGGQCRVYKVVMLNGETKALRFWNNLMDEVEERCSAISSYISKYPSPYFLTFEYISSAFNYKGDKYPAILMDWCPAAGLKTYIRRHLEDKKILKELQDNFINLIRELHSRKISHGDLHHDNIRVYDDGRLVLIDYDSLYVPGLHEYSDNCLGYSGYQLPNARENNKKLSAKADYFSELIIYLSIETLIEFPFLWNDLDIDNRDQSFIFIYKDYKDIKSTNIYNKINSGSKKLSTLLFILCYYLSKTNVEDLVPFYEVPSILNLSSILADKAYSCINCGEYFFASEDAYCTKCGCKRS